MEIIIGRNEQTIQAKKITIKLNDDIEFDISINNFGELVVNKGQFGPGTGDLIIKPSVSNEIRIS